MAYVRILCDFLNEIMLKYEFSRIACEQQDESAAGSSSSSGHSCGNGVYRYSYHAPVGHSIPVEMVYTKMGSQLIVHCCVHIPSSKHSSVFSTVIPAKDTRYQHVVIDKRKVYNCFVSDVVHKLLTNLRRALCLPEIGTLQSLPHEIKLLIMSSLDVPSVLSLSAVNRDFYSLAQDEHLWRHMYIKRFGKYNCNESGRASWKKEFIELHLLNQNNQSDQTVPTASGPIAAANHILPPPFSIPYPSSSLIHPILDYPSYQHLIPGVSFPADPFVPALIPCPSLHDQLLFKEDDY